MSELASLHALIYGRVQGVFFRDFVSRHARALGLSGYVRNLPQGGAVEVKAEGERPKLDSLLEKLHQGPPGARVDRVDVEWAEYSGSFADFRIRYWD